MRSEVDKFLRAWARTALAGAIMAACSTALDSHSTVESITVTPSTASLAVGATMTLGANVLGSDGEAIRDVHVSWSTEDATIASVSAAGVVTGIRVGSVLVAASARGKDAFARLTIVPTPVASVRLSTLNHAMFMGESLQITAEPLDGAGLVLAGRPVTWSSSNESVASVTDDGLVTALGTGGAIITASSEGKSAVASITVTSIPVASVDVWPDDNDVVVGQSTQLTVDVRDATGAPLVDRVVVWSTSDALVASVTSQGVVTAIAPGSALISASVEGKSASSSVIVRQRPVSAVILSPEKVTIFSGQAIELSALVTDDRGQLLPGRPVSFVSSNPQVATVSAGGVVTGVSTGAVTITASSEGATGTATVTVAADPVASVSLSPSTASLSIGQPMQLTLIAHNAAGAVLSLTGRTVTWTSSVPAVASVTNSGFVTALSAGTTVIIVTVDGKQASSAVSVRVVSVASVQVSPATANVVVGTGISLTASPRDSSGQPLYARTITWSSTNTAVATVNNSGVVTGVTTGSATIRATSEGKIGSAAITVVPVPVASVTVSPSAPNVNVGQTVQLTATPYSFSGQPLTGRATTWSTSAATIATVSSSGMVTGVGAGNAVITATIEGKTGTANVTVQVQIASVSISPASATVNVAWTTTLAATARTANNQVIPGVQFTWSSTNTAVATVSSSGVVTGVAPGSATIRAEAGGKTGSAAITVQLAPVDHIVVTPANPTVNIGQTVQLTATVYDAQNHVLTGRTVTWSTADATKATVTSNGRVTAIRKGSVTITASSGGKSGSTTVTIP